MALSPDAPSPATADTGYRLERRAVPPLDPEQIARLAIGSDGTLALTDADKAYADVLRDIVGTINAAPTISVKVPVPGSKDHGITFRTVARTDPDFPELLADYLDQKYDLVLIPPDELLDDES